MIIWTLAIIIGFFVLMVLIRPKLKKWFGIKICAICAAVSSTWIFLLMLRFLGYKVDNLVLGILMGQSVVGVMYLFEKVAKQKAKTNLLWIKIFIILLGTSLVYFVVDLKLDIFFWVLLLLILLFAVTLISLLKGKKSQSIVDKKYGRFKSEIKKLEDKFEHCCD